MKKVLLTAIAFLFIFNSVSILNANNCSTSASGSKDPNLIEFLAQQEYPCPSGYVYCEHYRCGKGFCCPWGYFYSNSCTCECYRTLEDARADCEDGAVFQCR
jgi:hypothetical protein